MNVPDRTSTYIFFSAIQEIYHLLISITELPYLAVIYCHYQLVYHYSIYRKSPAVIY